MESEDVRMAQPVVSKQPVADKGCGAFAPKKGKKASGRMEKNVIPRAVAPTDGDVDVTAPAPARLPAKKFFLKKVGPLIRRRVLNTIVKGFFIPSTPVFRENDTKVVDGVLADLPSVTRSEPTAAILPKL